MEKENIKNFIATEFEGMKIVKCSETTTTFLVLIIPESSNSTNAFSKPVAINKKTGDWNWFEPLDMPLDEYKAAVDITEEVNG